MRDYGTAIYQSEEDNDDNVEENEAANAVEDAAGAGGGAARQQRSSKMIRTDIEERALDPNHNFFLLVDSGTADQVKGKDAEMRARFERCVSLWSTSTSTSTGANQPLAGAALNCSLGGASSEGAGTSAGPGSSLLGLQTGTAVGQSVATLQSSSMHEAGAPPAGVRGAISGPLSRQGSVRPPATTGTATGSFEGQGTGSSSRLQPGGSITSRGGGHPGPKGAGLSTAPVADSGPKPVGSAGAEEELRVPMCGLVVGGDRFTLRQVYCSVIQNRCPMVVTKVSRQSGRRLF
ncbi:unnamed protein product [Protopolystoma xenopodis]|uniref:TRPM SLOG domain-containing protein n=1 Tax=Protopolystoma xenopodis TaxID=117903 RepID=A0A3S5B8L5_9PLAT|nr:unnamed protein product [Protopolystoma xenopodis]